MSEQEAAPLSSDAGGGEVRGARRARSGKRETGWFVGLLLIGLGVVFLLENAGWEITQNWWAAFVYLAAAGAFANMWREMRQAGFFDSKATGSLTWGLVLTTVATIFLFNLSWDRWWPVVLLAVGSGILVGWFLGNSSDR